MRSRACASGSSSAGRLEAPGRRPAGNRQANAGARLIGWGDGAEDPGRAARRARGGSGAHRGADSAGVWTRRPCASRNPSSTITTAAPGTSCPVSPCTRIPITPSTTPPSSSEVRGAELISVTVELLHRGAALHPLGRIFAFAMGAEALEDAARPSDYRRAGAPSARSLGARAGSAPHAPSSVRYPTASRRGHRGCDPV